MRNLFGPKAWRKNAPGRNPTKHAISCNTTEDEPSSKKKSKLDFFGLVLGFCFVNESDYEIDWMKIG